MVENQLMVRNSKELTIAILTSFTVLVTTCFSSIWVHAGNPITISRKADWSPIVGNERQHQIRLGADGVVRGRVSALLEDGNRGLAGLDVYFIQQGSVRAKAVTDDQGIFIARGLDRGDYSFVAIGEQGAAIYGVRVLPPDNELTPDEMEIAAIADGISSVIEMVQQPGNRDMDRLKPVPLLQSAEVAPGANRVLLNDGQLRGGLFAFAQGDSVRAAGRVFLLSDGEIIAETETDRVGDYRFNNITTGVYNLVAVGPAGVAAVSVEALGPEDAPVLAGNKVQGQRELVAFQPAPRELDTPIVAERLNVYLANLNFPAQRADDEAFTKFAPIEYANEPIRMGGGIGFGGAGPGLPGRPALIGLIGGLIPVLDDDDPAASSPFALN